MKFLSIIVPCFNEEENLSDFFNCLDKTLKKVDYEVIFVNDGSNDNSLQVLKDIYKKNKRKVKIISFSRNFNKDAAIYAGMKNASAKYTCIIDADLQQHPKYILDMIDAIENNEDIDQIAMINYKRKENIFVKFLKKSFYKIINLLSEIKFMSGASDFRLMNKNVVEAVLSMSENNRFSKGLFSWVGFNTYYMNYDVEERKKGKTKFGIRQSFKYAYNGIINCSIKPLKISTYVGAISSILSFIFIIEIIIEKVFFNRPVAGYPTIMCAILFLGGIQLITIGILGEYLSKTYLEAKKRPAFIIKEKYGFKDK